MSPTLIEPLPEEQPLPEISRKSETFVDYFQAFTHQLSPQTELWDDPLDQLAELFADYLHANGLLPQQITQWQTDLYAQTKDRQLASS